MTRGARNHWGWGFEDAVSAAARRARRGARRRRERSASASTELEEPVPLTASRCRRRGVARRRARWPTICSTDDHDARLARLGKSYLDVVRAFRGRFEHAARRRRAPARRGATSRPLLEWAAGANVAVIPYGGGTSVVGGVEPRGPGRFDGVVVARPRRARPRARGRRRLARRADPGRARRGPRLEEQLARARPDAALLPAVVRALDARRLDRHARRRALRDAARRTSTTSSSPCARSRRAATWESRRLPGSGAGPSPDRMLLGSRGDPRRHHRGVGARAAAARRTAPARAVRFADVRARAPRRCARSSQSGLRPVQLPADRRARRRA